MWRLEKFRRRERGWKKVGLCLVAAAGWAVPSDVWAAVCFLPDCVDKKLKFVPSGVESCLAAGYESSSSRICPEYSNIEHCPENSSYIKCNLRQWCLDHAYVETECDVPYYLDEKCPNGEELYKNCSVDYERSCQDLSEDYVAVCPDGFGRDETEVCPYSNLYAKCCNLCEGFDYEADEIPEGYVAGNSCFACGDVMKYEKEVNPCIGYQRCPDGHKSGTGECRHGDEIWYEECGAYECDLPFCPEGTECRFEACSEKYCGLGCLADYENYCTVPITDCNLLGYTREDCAGDRLICPYDEQKYYCI